MAASDLIGKRFGRLLVQSKSEVIYIHRRIKWNCLCDCGNSTLVATDKLNSGRTRSCGCLHTKHGFSGSKAQHIMDDLVQRCNNPQNKAYKNYGGRGIKISEEWSGENRVDFYKWYEKEFEIKVEEKGTKRLEVDRIDNDGPYAPWNCHLVTHTENNRNKRTSRKIYIFGEVLCVTEAMEKYCTNGLARNSIFSRLNHGMSPEEDLQKPKIPRGKGVRNAN